MIGFAPHFKFHREMSIRDSTRGISVTNGIAVNGYSKKRSEADAFASWLSTEGAAKLYDRTGHVAALQTAASQNGEMAAFWQERCV